MEKDNNSFFEILEIKNISTDTVIIGAAENIEILTSEKSAITIGTKKILSQEGQLVSIKANLLEKENKFVEVLFIGKIGDIVLNSQGTQKTHIKFKQFDKIIWGAYLEKIDSKKNKVEKLFNSMRDDE